MYNKNNTNNILVKERIFKNGKAFKTTMTHDNGTKHYEVSYNENGQRTGPYESFHDNGKPKCKGIYVKGEFVGLYQVLYMNGNKNIVATYDADRTRYQQWDSCDNLIRDYTMIRGMYVGLYLEDNRKYYYNNDGVMVPEREYLESLIPANDTGFLLIKALEDKDIVTVKFLIEQGVNLNVTKNGKGVLYYAIKSGDMTTVKLLRSKGQTLPDSIVSNKEMVKELFDCLF